MQLLLTVHATPSIHDSIPTLRFPSPGRQGVLDPEKGHHVS